MSYNNQEVCQNRIPQSILLEKSYHYQKCSIHSRKRLDQVCINPGCTKKGLICNLCKYNEHSKCYAVPFETFIAQVKKEWDQPDIKNSFETYVSKFQDKTTDIQKDYQSMTQAFKLFDTQMNEIQQETMRKVRMLIQNQTKSTRDLMEKLLIQKHGENQQQLVAKLFNVCEHELVENQSSDEPPSFKLKFHQFSQVKDKIEKAYQQLEIQQRTLSKTFEQIIELMNEVNPPQLNVNISQNSQASQQIASKYENNNLTSPQKSESVTQSQTPNECSYNKILQESLSSKQPIENNISNNSIKSANNNNDQIVISQISGSLTGNQNLPQSPKNMKSQQSSYIDQIMTSKSYQNQYLDGSDNQGKQSAIQKFEASPCIQTQQQQQQSQIQSQQQLKQKQQNDFQQQNSYVNQYLKNDDKTSTVSYNFQNLYQSQSSQNPQQIHASGLSGNDFPQNSQQFKSPNTQKDYNMQKQFYNTHQVFREAQSSYLQPENFSNSVIKFNSFSTYNNPVQKNIQIDENNNNSFLLLSNYLCDDNLYTRDRSQDYGEANTVENLEELAKSQKEFVTLKVKIRHSDQAFKLMPDRKTVLKKIFTDLAKIPVLRELKLNFGQLRLNNEDLQNLKDALSNMKSTVERMSISIDNGHYDQTSLKEFMKSLSNFTLLSGYGISLTNSCYDCGVENSLAEQLSQLSNLKMLILECSEPVNSMEIATSFKNAVPQLQDITINKKQFQFE
ncbi:hypothetical protein PPERSA_05200 [Pseudocohnilembus persalinus]|uniref:Uncharacterized protein n=1 Tax=Pseudocohnilembus persalinus TaxID=266149 RepID=A0A0V0R9E1_PSEPJ|nr:hypothetical protein PPERSA_05200 [Pseudocohnilembus persalinus]|eukprot:KRX11091.1 hypothetical protein PPERSA_05200 [Pseudocohnilembus persalinus]